MSEARGASRPPDAAAGPGGALTVGTGPRATDALENARRELQRIAERNDAVQRIAAQQRDFERGQAAFREVLAATPALDGLRAAMQAEADRVEEIRRWNQPAVDAMRSVREFWQQQRDLTAPMRELWHDLRFGLEAAAAAKAAEALNSTRAEQAARLAASTSALDAARATMLELRSSYTEDLAGSLVRQQAALADHVRAFVTPLRETSLAFELLRTAAVPTDVSTLVDTSALVSAFRPPASIRPLLDAWLTARVEAPTLDAYAAVRNAYGVRSAGEAALAFWEGAAAARADDAQRRADVMAVAVPDADALLAATVDAVAALPPVLRDEPETDEAREAWSFALLWHLSAEIGRRLGLAHLDAGRWALLLALLSWLFPDPLGQTKQEARQLAHDARQEQSLAIQGAVLLALREMSGDALRHRVRRDAPLREDGAPRAAILGRLRPGELVEERGRVQPWVLIERLESGAAEPRTGWVHSRHLELMPRPRHSALPTSGATLSARD